MVRAEVTYGDVTEDGLLREPVFKGLRDDQSEPASPAIVRTSGAVPKENYLATVAGRARADERAAGGLLDERVEEGP